MAIITIARERGAYGRIIAEKLVKALGAHFIDKEIVDRRLEDLGISEKRRMQFDERRPGFFSTLTSAVEEYVSCLKLVLYEEASDGNCVILGRGGQTLFKNVPGSLSVRMIAPQAIRCERVAAAENITVSQARQLVEKIDKNREGFNAFFFDNEWANPQNYDVVYNTATLSADCIAAQIATLTTRMTDEMKEQGRQMLKNLILAQRIERHLLYVEKIPIFFLNVTCDGGNVLLNGIVHSMDAIDKAKSTAKISGVDNVECKLQIGLHGRYQGHSI